jgi:hypothetical protein
MANQAMAKFDSSLRALFLLLRLAERLCCYKPKRSQRPSCHVTVDKQVEEACH